MRTLTSTLKWAAILVVCAYLGLLVIPGVWTATHNPLTTQSADPFTPGN